MLSSGGVTVTFIARGQEGSATAACMACSTSS